MDGPRSQGQRALYPQQDHRREAAWAELPKLPRLLEWVAINPGLVLGPVLDNDSSASVQIVVKLLKDEIPGLPRFGYPIVDVRDLADLHVRAMTASQAAGQRYIGSGPYISLSEIANVLKNRLGDKVNKVPTQKLPDWVVRRVGLFDKEVRGQLFELGKIRRPSSAKAAMDLGWSSRAWEDTIMNIATSLEAVGAMNRARSITSVFLAGCCIGRLRPTNTLRSADPP